MPLRGERTLGISRMCAATSRPDRDFRGASTDGVVRESDLCLTVVVRQNEWTGVLAAYRRAHSYDLNDHVLVLRQLLQMLKLCPHHLRATDTAVEETLIDQCHEHRRIFPGQYLLPLHTHSDPIVVAEDRPGVLFGLQQ